MVKALTSISTTHPLSKGCRLRYRIIETQLRMWHEIINPEKALEDAVQEVWARIEEETGRTIFNSHV